MAIAQRQNHSIEQLERGKERSQTTTTTTHHITSQISIHKRNLQTHSKCKMLTNRTHCMAVNFNFIIPNRPAMCASVSML